MKNITLILSRALVRIFSNFKIKSNLINFIKYQLGISNLISNSRNYDAFTDINQAENKIFSQNGEDGIIDYLIQKLEINKPNFVEIGIGEYVEANTRFLYDRFYPKGLVVDQVENLKKKVFSNINSWKGDLRVIESAVSSKNINKILNENCDFEIDVFSLDIDGVDYWIIDQLENNISKIFVSEYNSVFGDSLEVTIPNLENFNRSDYHFSNLCYGVSLKLLIKIMKKKNFYFIGTNLLKNNAFFISKDFPKDKYFPNIKIKELNYYTDSNVRESRDDNGNLNYLSGTKKIKQIKNCTVTDFFNNEPEEKKIVELINS